MLLNTMLYYYIKDIIPIYQVLMVHMMAKLAFTFLFLIK